jgi:myb proto-oncogene protein
MWRPPHRPSKQEAGDGATKLKKGPWTPEEDRALIEYMVGNNGCHGNWQRLPLLAGINRCGKSCRLRCNNYLRPDINPSAFTDEEDKIIIHLHSIMGNRSVHNINWCK